MFANAYALASKFTFPLIISERTVGGKCASSIGAYILINDQGWIVTAGHMLQHLMALSASTIRCRDHAANASAIRNDQTLSEKGRKARLRALGLITNSDVSQCSALWGGSPTSLTLDPMQAVSIVDLGIGKLDPFVASPGQVYPVFKDPRRDYEPGVSLCKLGFPFHTIVPTYDAAQNRFELPNGALPAPLFPMEGIFTRTIAHVAPAGTNPTNIPLLWLETSSPGLRGQSGGPTFDKNGIVWAIQSSTSSYDLGFNPSNPQFLHVGLGVHMATLFNVLDTHNVQYAISNY